MDIASIDAMAAECMKDVDEIGDDDDIVDDADLLVIQPRILCFKLILYYSGKVIYRYPPAERELEMTPPSLPPTPEGILHIPQAAKGFFL